jgi:hypothetical protein
LNRASGPVPSALPVTPAEPASVVTTAAGVIFLMVWLPRSATTRFPSPSMATPPSGYVKRASEPVPSALPEFPARPAKVVTTPAGVIRRTVWFALSVR